jgi:tetratricopeptide (TPR) repeat protein
MIPRLRRQPASLIPAILLCAACVAWTAETEPGLAETTGALHAELPWPVQLALRKKGGKQTLVASLRLDGEEPAPFELDELYAPLFKIGRTAALRIPEATHIELATADPAGRQVFARVSAQAIQQLHERKISADDFKSKVVYKVETAADVTAEDLYQSALSTNDGEVEIELLKKAAARDDTCLNAQAMLGFLLYSAGDVKNALPHLQAAVKLAPQYLEPRWFLVSALRDTSAWEPMLEQIRLCEAIAINDDCLIVPHLDLPPKRAKNMSDAWTKNVILREVSQIKCAYLIQFNKPEAAAALKTHLKTWPDDPLGHYHQGVVSLSKNDYSTAHKELELTVTFNPRAANAWRLLGLIYGDRKKFKDEALALRCALTAGDEQADNYVKLSYAYAQLNEWHDCKHVAAEGLARHPNEATLRLNFKEAHKRIVAQNLKQTHPFYPLTAPLDIQNTDLSAAEK